MVEAIFEVLKVFVLCFVFAGAVCAFAMFLFFPVNDDQKQAPAFVIYRFFKRIFNLGE